MPSHVDSSDDVFCETLPIAPLNHHPRSCKLTIFLDTSVERLSDIILL